LSLVVVFALALAAAQPPQAAEPVFSSSGGLAPGWEDYGWAVARDFRKGAPARLDLSGRGGWILHHAPLDGPYERLVFQMKAPEAFGNFLEVSLGSPRGVRFPAVVPDARQRKSREDGWVEISLPMSALNPSGAVFDRIVLRAKQVVSADPVLLDGISLVAGGQAASSARPARDVPVVVDCRAASHPINPMIYGIAYSFQGTKDEWVWELNPGARRWGGNPSSRYNWELGNAWNTASDWFFQNVDYTGRPRYSYDEFLDDELRHGIPTALTVPTLGWVAKDTRSWSFPVSLLGKQQATAPENADAGNGIAMDGTKVSPGSPDRTSRPAPPAFVERWIRAIRARDATRGRSVQMVFLDNEPTLWDSTHRDVHPQPVGYDELLERTLTYAGAVRRADADAVIGGPVAWGWPAYFYSGKDAAVGLKLHPDRALHGNVPLIPWWLRNVRKAEKASGTRLVDLLDLHFYPQGVGLGIGQSGDIDRETAARRIRAARALWDPGYRDESWIDEPIQLIPRMKKWVADEAPGLGLVIGEYNFGAELDMSGGLALAEALGHFGTEGLTAAFYWTYPAKNSAAYWAFRAFRNYDGRGGRFQDFTAAVRTAAPLSVFASRDSALSRVVLVLLSEDRETGISARVDLSRCGAASSVRLHTYAGTATGFNSTTPASLDLSLPPWSISVLDVTLAK
jgi:hypothetical protein